MARGSLLSLLVLLALSVAGCGESEKEKYVGDLEPLNNRLLDIGESLATGLGSADKQTNAQLADRFGKYASDLDRVNDDIAALDTPAELEDESKALTARVDVVVEDLKKISAAARENDPREAAAATVALGDDSDKLNRAQNRLARATGADIGRG